MAYVVVVERSLWALAYWQHLLLVPFVYDENPLFVLRLAFWSQMVKIKGVDIGWRNAF